MRILFGSRVFDIQPALNKDERNIEAILILPDPSRRRMASASASVMSAWCVSRCIPHSDRDRRLMPLL